MKRKLDFEDDKANEKEAKTPEKALRAKDYCDVEPVRCDGGIVWPAPLTAIESARNFIRNCAKTKQNVLVVPDKDADGLTSGAIIRKTLIQLGLSENLIKCHLIRKGSSVHEEVERNAMQQFDASHIIVLDQGGRLGPRLVDNPTTRGLVIDHHLSDEFPQDATVVTACHYPPVATSSLLTFEICKELHPAIEEECAWLCAVGTHGDLGNTLKWKPPFPDMTSTFKTYSKKLINDAVSLLNAPRRTATFDVISAWDALIAAQSPKDLFGNARLQAARSEINFEVEKNTHAPPKFSKDGKIAVLRINTQAQVHPVIATRWAGFLKSKALEIVMVANHGYIPGMVNFSCRIAKCAKDRDPPVNIISCLKAAAGLSDDGLISRLGESFARGHKEASGGIVPESAFEELMLLLKVGEKPDKPEGESPKKAKKVEQKNNLMNYFAKSQAKSGG